MKVIHLEKGFLTGLILVVCGLAALPGLAQPELEIEVRLVSPGVDYYAHCPVFFEFSITNVGDTEVLLPFKDPFFGTVEGFYLEAAPLGGTDYQSYSSGWHQFHRDSTAMPSLGSLRSRGTQVDPGETVSWICYGNVPEASERQGFAAGSYLVRARLIDDLVLHIDIISAEIELEILPPPPGEDLAYEQLTIRDSWDNTIKRIDTWPDSLYAPHLLNYMAWNGERMIAKPHSVDRAHSVALPMALECRRRLREKYPDWMYNDEGLFREAAVRVKVGEPEKAVELLETLMRDYPDSPLTPKAKAILPEIRDLVVNRDKYDFSFGMTTLPAKAKLFNLTGPERSSVE